MPKQPEFLVSTVRQMEALTSPVRHQIHLVMEMLGACSVNELAERMGRVPETLYYHVRRLEQVGILEQVGSRVVSSREEAIYQLKAKRLKIDPNQSSPRFLKAMAKGCGSLLRFAQRAFERALDRKPTSRPYGRGGQVRFRGRSRVAPRGSSRDHGSSGGAEARIHSSNRNTSCTRSAIERASMSSRRSSTETPRPGRKPRHWRPHQRPYGISSSDT